MSALARYDEICRALAEDASVAEVLSFRDEMEHVKLYGRQIKDRELIAKATVRQTEAERRLGELLLEAERLGWIGRGRPKAADENVPTPEHFTLEEAGIDRKLSSRAQKLALIPKPEFEAGLADVRERIVSGEATIINGARAIMGSRQEPDDSLDFFPTPPWATRALIERVFPHLNIGRAPRFQTAWEPACGEGHMAEVLAEYFRETVATDIHDYHYQGATKFDFILGEGPPVEADWIITNPPFEDRTESFVLRALDLAHHGVAMFVRLQWLETIGRYENIFRDHPPTLIAFFAERVNLCKGHWDPDGGTATAYIWLVWRKGEAPQAPFWIPPGCKENLSKVTDRMRFTTHPVTARPRSEAAA